VTSDRRELYHSLVKQRDEKITKEEKTINAWVKKKS
jgi:hypothetical protein